MTIKECVHEILKSEPGLSNSEVAEKVRERLNSNTTARNISWYISRIALTDMPDLPISDEDLEIAAGFNESVKEDEIENWQQAESFVLKYEHRKGAKSVHNAHSISLGYDIISNYPDGETRLIAIKSRKDGKLVWLDLTSNEITAMLNEPNFWLYIVEGNFQNGKVQVVEIPREDLLKTVKIKIHGRISNLATYRRHALTVEVNE